MKKNKGDFTSSIIWTNESQYLNDLYKMYDEMLIAILKKEMLNSVGNIKKIISKQIFPLSSHLNSRLFEKRTLYIGDSAHSFHPIAGQGWNLGMSEVENLYKLVKQYKSLGIELGDSFFCKKYHNDNFYGAYRLYQITDKLDSIFQIQNPLIYLARSSGINFINNKIKLKNMISDFAMGIN
jgi:2-polyprenyl-6-methoxyphenol hydroxylase and related FAD-dependent oxidoreductases